MSTMFVSGCIALSCLSMTFANDFVNRFPQFKSPDDYNTVGRSPHSPQPPSQIIGNITSFQQSSPTEFTVNCSEDVVRIQFFREDIFRVWLAWDGQFTDPASSDIVVGVPDKSLNIMFHDKGDYFELGAASEQSVKRSGGGVTLRLAKKPFQLSAYRHDAPLWVEEAGLARNDTATYQTLKAAEDEFFFGGGMQNGRFSHRGHRIRISTDYNWADGGNPNAAPFYLSSAGYAVYRNTWSPGFYDFSQDSPVLAHNESRFDAFYFAAAPRDFKALLGGYTFVTGRPFMPPLYGLGLGDSDCYHNARHGNNTNVVLAVADKYRELDIPASWFLPNDGYGCGFGVGPSNFPSNFSTLDEVVASLHKRGFQTGLWSSTGLPNISREVRGSGTRIAKTDVGWIGNGYKFAFDAVREVTIGIENNSNARRFIWTVEGWAGTQRFAVMWAGDDSGSFDYLRWQIPTYVGSGFSAQAHVSGDIDGIFGGSPETYVRDLQFKCFMTVMMVMSGWAANPDKQPWTWGEPYTSINRMYLKLKVQLTPYMYSLSRIAHDTGVPPVRAMALEFPEDVSTFSNHTGSSQQFMSGPFLLVAPVYRPISESATRNGIYLPAGQWVDYWNGSIVDGPVTINGYPVPLDTLPIFVRAGAIIPMWPQMQYPGASPADPLTLDVYPSGNSSFQLYEDDGLTREALELGSYALTNITCSASSETMVESGDLEVAVSASAGNFVGKLQNRSYEVRIHLSRTPADVHLWRAGKRMILMQRPSLSALDFAESGWMFSNAVQRGLVLVKTPSLPTDIPFKLVVSSNSGANQNATAPFLQPDSDAMWI